ncbi:MAG: hypothetical protein NUV56_03185 [Candidatus Uhrbacteria bacterium]|nr:hypothetical protein [Candidatus Uhrbacteria bacterium]
MFVLSLFALSYAGAQEPSTAEDKYRAELQAIIDGRDVDQALVVQAKAQSSYDHAMVSCRAERTSYLDVDGRRGKISATLKQGLPLGASAAFVRYLDDLRLELKDIEIEYTDILTSAGKASAAAKPAREELAVATRYVTTAKSDQEKAKTELRTLNSDGARASSPFLLDSPLPEHRNTSTVRPPEETAALPLPFAGCFPSQITNY